MATDIELINNADVGEIYDDDRLQSFFNTANLAELDLNDTGLSMQHLFPEMSLFFSLKIKRKKT